MSFTRVNPSAWAVGDKVTSAQMNQLDGDHFDSVDKTVAGDQISGEIVFDATGRLVLQYSGSGSGFDIQCQSTLSNALNVNSGGQLLINDVGGIEVTVNNGIKLDGATNWVSFTSTRTRSIVQPLISPSVDITQFKALGWSGMSMVSQATGAFAPFLLTNLHDGATLTSVTMFLVVSNPHSAGAPAVLPSFGVYRRTLATSDGSDPALNSTDPQPFSPTPASGSAWHASGNVQSWSYACNQNNVIDRSQYAYYVALTDESGTNAETANGYTGMLLTYGAIGDMRFP